MKPRMRWGWQVRVWKYVSSQLSVADDLWRIPVNGPGSCTVLGQLSFLGAGERPFQSFFLFPGRPDTGSIASPCILLLLPFHSNQASHWHRRYFSKADKDNTITFCSSTFRPNTKWNLKAEKSFAGVILNPHSIYSFVLSSV